MPIKEYTNRLINEKSPYLLQHAHNPVDWFPWGDEAFNKAKAEDKPIFLSIGYSTCHWCHVMAHESFEDVQTAAMLNEYFVSVKVDKEERPDIDGIYMAVCQALTGSGGWPTTIFMTPEKKPFFAGTYFPKTARTGMPGLTDLLKIIHDKWESDRASLLKSADEITAALSRTHTTASEADSRLIVSAIDYFKNTFDERFGGFGTAPKFPAPHNLLFLMNQYAKSGRRDLLKMAEKTLSQMAAGGLFDHIGYGFSRYSTDRYFLAPHFEKMLYDNALLILAYVRAYSLTKKTFYFDIAEKTALYILREMTSPEGGFYSAQDADSEGEEGKYYLFEPAEIISLLGREKGEAFNRSYDITEEGNFEGKNIPNRLKNKNTGAEFENCLPKIADYRRQRCRLHLDDKILTSWNSLMIAALCSLYRISRNKGYLNAALKAERFIENNLTENETLFVSFREGRRGEKGFIDDYANHIFSLLALYDSTLDASFLGKALRFCNKTVSDFFDAEQGGFYFCGKENEALILRRKETYDGAIPSGNSVMCYNLVRLLQLTGDKETENLLKRQLDYMSGEAETYPAGYSLFLLAMSDYFDPPKEITVVVKEQRDLADLPLLVPLDSVVKVLNKQTDDYPLKNDKTTFYVCHNHRCLPPTNHLGYARVI